MPLDFFNVGLKMSYNLRPTEPSWETAHRCLPQEYTERSDLYNSDITSKASMDPSEKWNILLIKRMELFSEQGYVTTDEYKNSTRVWAAFYFGENNEPNGIVLSMVANDFFYAWKGRVLSPEKTIQSVTWTKEKGFSFEIFKKDGRFPAILKNALFNKHVTEDVELNCEIQTITSVEKEKLMEYCGNSRPHFPSNVEK